MSGSEWLISLGIVGLIVACFLAMIHAKNECEQKGGVYNARMAICLNKNVVVP